MADLWQEYQLDRSIFNRNKLIEANLLLVYKVVARRFPGFKEGFDDFYQVGMIGLIKAIEGFDPSLGSKFSSYACVKIVGEIQHYLRDKRDVIRPPRGTNPPPILSLDSAAVYDFDGDWLEWVDLNESIADGFWEPEDWSDLNSAIESLPEQQGHAIKLHFFKGLNRKQVAERLGVGPTTITRWFAANIRELQRILTVN